MLHDLSINIHYDFIRSFVLVAGVRLVERNVVNANALYLLFTQAAVYKGKKITVQLGGINKDQTSKSFDMVSSV